MYVFTFANPFPHRRAPKNLLPGHGVTEPPELSSPLDTIVGDHDRMNGSEPRGNLDATKASVAEQFRQLRLSGTRLDPDGGDVAKLRPIVVSQTEMRGQAVQS